MNPHPSILFASSHYVWINGEEESCDLYWITCWRLMMRNDDDHHSDEYSHAWKRFRGKEWENNWQLEHSSSTTVHLISRSRRNKTTWEDKTRRRRTTKRIEPTMIRVIHSCHHPVMSRREGSSLYWYQMMIADHASSDEERSQRPVPAKDSSDHDDRPPLDDFSFYPLTFFHHSSFSYSLLPSFFKQSRGRTTGGKTIFMKKWLTTWKSFSIYLSSLPEEQEQNTQTSSLLIKTLRDEKD